MKNKIIATASFLAFVLGAAWLNSEDSIIALLTTSAGFIGLAFSYYLYKNNKL